MWFVLRYLFFSWLSNTIIKCETPIERLFVSIEGDTSKLLADVDEGVDKSVDKLGKLDDAGQKTGSGLKGAAGIAGAAFGLAAGAASKLLDVILKLAVAVPQFFANLAQETIQANAQFENFEIQLTTLLGSATAAQERLASLARFGVETPFELPEVVEANRTLELFGGAALATDENLRLLGDAAAGVNQNFQSVAFWSGRMYDAIQNGQPFGEAALRLQEMGILTGETRRQLEAMQKAGEDGEKVWEVFAEAIGSKFAGNMERLSKTFQGVMSNLADFRGNLLRVGGAEFFDAIREAAIDFLAVLNENSPQIEEIATSIGEIGATLVQLFRELGADISVKGILDQLQAFVEWLSRTTKAASAFIVILKAWLSPIAEVVGGLAKFLISLTPIGRAIQFLVEEVFPRLDEALIAGAQVLALSAAGWEGLLATLRPLGEVITLIGESINALAHGDFATAGQKAQEALDQIKEGLFDVDAGAQAARDSLLKSAESIENLTNPIEDVKDAADDATKAIEEMGDATPDTTLTDKLDDLATQMIDATRERDEKLQELEKDHQEKLADIAQDGAEKRADIEEKAAEDLEKLTADTEKKRAEIISKAQEDLGKLAEDTDRELAKRRTDHNKEEVRETEDHLKEMRRLTEDHLLQLSDAVRERDAGAIVDLQRKFALESARREEDFSTQQGRDRQDFDAELADLRDNEARRRQEILDNQAKELQDLITAEEEKRAEIEARRQEELVKLDENLADRLNKENENYTERQAALDEALRQRLEAIARSLADEAQITDEGARAILETLNDYFGIGGDVDKLMEDFINRRNMKMEIKVNFEQGQMPLLPPTPPTGPNGLPVAGPFAKGGTAFASQPTLALFGEAGPEIAQFTPVAQLMGMQRDVVNRGRFDHRMSFDNLPGGMDEERIGNIAAGAVLRSLEESGLLGDQE